MRISLLTDSSRVRYLISYVGQRETLISIVRITKAMNK